MLLRLDKYYSRTIVAAFILFLLGSFSSQWVWAATVTPRVEINAEPGQTVRETFKITNEERQSKTFYLSFENFQSVDESGNPSFTGGFNDLATWIEGPLSATVGPGDSKEVPIIIRVPANAEPGGHFAAIFLSTEPPGSANPGQVGISAKLGSLVLLRVGGEFEQGGDILEFATDKKHRLFTELPITFYYRFQNTGDDHIKPLGDVQIANTFGATSKLLPANPVDGSVLPKSIRRFETSWVDSGRPLKQNPEAVAPEAARGFFGHVIYQLRNFAFGKYTAKLKIAYGTPELKSTKASFTFFVFPWQLIITSLAVLALALIFFWQFLKRYNRYIIGKANRRSRK